MSDTVRRNAWRDKANVPSAYNGTMFRSGLEANVARFLDECAVHWRYEAPTEFSVLYLPDFTIDWAPDYLDLPRWVEVKPQEMLYDLRDALGVPELFHGEQWRTVTAKELLRLNDQFVELYKPKRLAEAASDRVLVTAVANRDRTLSLEMQPDGIIFSRAHAFVNRRGVLRAAEREAERRRWEEHWARQRQRDEEARRARQVELAAVWRRIGAELALEMPRQARYDGGCNRCERRFAAANLTMWRYSDHWIVLCADCRVALVCR